MSTVIVVSAGLSEPSSSHLLADRLSAAVRKAARQRDTRNTDAPLVETRRVNVRDIARDIADAMVSNFVSARLRAVLDDLGSAEALIAVTPTFNASYSGLFKSFFDVSEPGSLVGKPVLIAATGGTERHSLVLDYALRPLFAYMRAIVISTGVYAAASDWGAGQRLSSRIDRAAAELVGVLEGDRATPNTDPFTDLVPFESLLRGERD